MRHLLDQYLSSFRGLQRNIWVLALSMLINRSGSMVLMFTTLYLTRDLHFTKEAAGITLSFYGIGSVLGSFAGGWITDRMHHRPIMIFSLVGSGLILFLLLFAESQWAIASILFFYAFVADMFRPANSAAIALFSQPETRTRSVSLVRLAVNLGFTVGPAAGGFIAASLGFKTLFVIDSLTGFAAALMLVLFLPAGEKKAHQTQKQEIPVRGLSAYRDWIYLSFILLVALYGTSFFQLFASMPQFFKEVFHYDEETIGMLLALNGFLVVLIEMPLVPLMERKGSLFGLIIIGVVFIPLSFLFLRFGNPWLGFSLIYTLLITLSEVFAMPFMMNYALSRGGEGRKGEYSALYSIAYGLSTIVAPGMGLGLADAFGFDRMLEFFMGLSLLTALGFFVLSRIPGAVLSKEMV